MMLGTAVCCLAMLAGVALAATPSVRYAHDWTKTYAKDQCHREKGCKSAAVGKCFRYRGAVQCVVLAQYKGEYCVYHTNTFYRNGILEKSISEPHCIGGSPRAHREPEPVTRMASR